MTTRTGMTLIETLVVVVLLSMLAAVGVAALGARSDEELLRDDATRMLGLDQHARLAAIRLGPVRLIADSDHGRVVLDHAAELLASLDSIQAQLVERDEGRNVPVDAIAFDRLGHSLDYTVVLTRGDARLLIDVAGLTGWWQVRSQP